MASTHNMSGEKLESTNGSDSSRVEEALSNHTERIDARKLVRKIDIRLLPICALIYAFALIDRVNLPNARIAGADEDLGLSIGSRYTIATLVFFLPYTFFEYPANVAIRKVGPALWLGGLAMGFGVTSIGMGFVKSWGALAGCRVLLGTFEAGLYPGCVYLLGCWYLRYEIQKRFTAFYLVAQLASGFGNILGYGLSQMEGVGGLRGWRWIFILEGIFTAFLGLLAFAILVGFPDKATVPGIITKKAFLTEAEAEFILARIEADRGDSKVDKMTWKAAKTYLKDWKIWEFAWIYLLAATVSYAFSLFLPIILEDELGYSTSYAQILAFPPFVAGAVYMFIVAFAGDHFHRRGVLIVINSVIALVGLVMVGFVTDPKARYAGTYLGVSGCNANIPTILALMHNNVVGQMKRSIATIMLIGGSGISGIITATIFRQQDAPGYRPALITVVVTQVVTILHILKNFYVFSRANKRADRGEILLENTPGFRYTL